MNDVQNFNPLWFDPVNDKVSAMLQVSVHTGFSRNETTDGMMKIFRRKLIEANVKFFDKYRCGRIGKGFEAVK